MNTCQLYCIACSGGAGAYIAFLFLVRNKSIPVYFSIPVAKMLHTGFFSLLGLYNRHSKIHSVPARSVHGLYLLMCLFPSYSGKRLLSTRTESTPPEFAGKNAYNLLGVSESSSFAEIKSSFRKLAKETHPDLVESPNDSSVAQRFVQILAAYEILSDSEKRAHYDRYLLSQRAFVQTQFRKGSVMYKYESHRATMKQMEVVEWLKWYRYAINDILSERRVVVGSGYFDVLERDFYSAIHAAYYGPDIESMDLLPDCFEAEERSARETPEVLHFVSGRDLFGMVCIAERVPELSHSFSVKLPPFASEGSGLCQSTESVRTQMESDVTDSGICQMHNNSSDHLISDAYKDLELHVSGRVVAVASRVPPKSYNNGMQNEDSADHIQVYLIPNEDLTSATHRVSKDSVMGVAVESRIPLGTIIGLGTSSEEGSCYVHDSCGIKTHLVMKHRTLLVKHLHWYQTRDEVSVCECRCSRARLPPSKFWLFEPRCGLHDIGGWYVETFGKDKKGQNVPSQRFWDGLDASEQFEKRLHPAMYLLALAYRTLDIESAKRRKQATKYTFAEKISRILSWWKKLV